MRIMVDFRAFYESNSKQLNKQDKKEFIKILKNECEVKNNGNDKG